MPIVSSAHWPVGLTRNGRKSLSRSAGLKPHSRAAQKALPPCPSTVQPGSSQEVRHLQLRICTSQIRVELSG